MEVKKKATSQKKMEYDKKYYVDHISRKVLNFNLMVDDDAELLAWLESKGRGEMSSYIKRLIREDMRKNKHESPA